MPVAVVGTKQQDVLFVAEGGALRWIEGARKDRILEVRRRNRVATVETAREHLHVET